MAGPRLPGGKLVGLCSRDECLGAESSDSRFLQSEGCLRSRLLPSPTRPHHSLYVARSSSVSPPAFYGEAGGQFIQTFTFTNVGRSVCQLRGWPSLELRGKSGRPVAVHSRRVVQGAQSAPPVRTVVLRRRGAASFDVYGADWNVRANQPCSHTTAIFVTAPGGRSMLSVAVKMPNCGLFDVAPVIAGKTDRQAWSRVWHK
jgi:hypothetical protein